MSIVASGLAPQQAELGLGVLGVFQARVDGRWVPAPTRQVARVATILAGWPGDPIERERIVAGLWGDATPATVTNTLQVHISQLRRLIGKQTVRCEGTRYILDVPPEAIDAEQLVEAVHEAARMRRREHYARAAELLAHATGLWRGTPFPDISDPELEARRARLAELHDQAREDLLECRLELARDRYELADVIAGAKELVALQPLREKGHVLLVRALAAADRSGEASQAFEQAAERLRSTMGLDPGRALVEVHAKSLNHDDALLPRAMRRVTVLPDGPTPTPEVSATAARVREAVVDLGAALVTVVTTTDDPARVAALASATAHSLDGDMPAGVRIVPSVPAERMAGVLDVVTGPASRSRAELLTRSPQMALVVIAMKPMGVAGEVVIDDPGRPAAASTPVGDHDRLADGGGTRQ